MDGESSLVGRSEVERRGEYIEIMIGGLNGDADHPLVVLVKECLANEPEKRPTAEEIVQRLQQKGYSKKLLHVTREVCIYRQQKFVNPIRHAWLQIKNYCVVVGGSKQTPPRNKH